MSDLIYENNDSLSNNNCKLFINYYKKQSMNTAIIYYKYTDLEINKILLDELKIHLNNFLIKTKSTFIPINKLSVYKYYVSNFIKSKNHILKFFNDKKPMFIYLFFLENSPEYLQFDDYKVKIEIGKLLMFPAEWFVIFENCIINVLHIAGVIYIE